MKLQVKCSSCGARYSVKKSFIGERFKCKCGVVFRARSDSATVANIPDNEEQLTTVVALSNSIIRNDIFLQALSETQSSTQSIEAPPEPRFTSDARGDDRRFKVTTAMGPYTGRLIFIAITVVFLVLFNGVLMAFLISPLTAIFIWSPIALLALFYKAIAVNSNKMVVEIDDQQLAVRFLKRLPWPCRDKVFAMELIREIYVENRLVRKPFFSSAHDNDTETFRWGKGGFQRVQYVYVYNLMVRMKKDRWPIFIATFEDQAIANSVLEFVMLTRI